MFPWGFGVIFGNCSQVRGTGPLPEAWGSWQQARFLEAKAAKSMAVAIEIIECMLHMLVTVSNSEIK